MTHTNVQIVDRFSTIENRLRDARQEAERKFWQETAEWLIRELQNIPEAIGKYGYVTLPDGTKLVPASRPQEP